MVIHSVEYIIAVMCYLLISVFPLYSGTLLYSGRFSRVHYFIVVTSACLESGPCFLPFQAFLKTQFSDVQCMDKECILLSNDTLKSNSIRPFGLSIKIRKKLV